MSKNHNGEGACSYNGIVDCFGSFVFLLVFFTLCFCVYSACCLFILFVCLLCLFVSRYFLIVFLLFVVYLVVFLIDCSVYFSFASYHSLLPLDDESKERSVGLFGFQHSTYKATRASDGEPVALRRVIGVANSLLPTAKAVVDTWKRVDHPAVVRS